MPQEKDMKMHHGHGPRLPLLVLGTIWPWWVRLGRDFG